MKDEWSVDGFHFDDKKEFEKALKEQKIIEEITKKMKITSSNNAYKIYAKSLEKNTFETVIGYNFLKKLREILENDKSIDKESIVLINIKKSAKNSEFFDKQEKNKLVKIEGDLKEYKRKIKSKNIVIVFMVLIIITLFVISMTSDNSAFVNEKNRVLNNYSKWEEKLNQKEEELNQREEELRQKEELK